MAVVAEACRHAAPQPAQPGSMHPPLQARSRDEPPYWSDVVVTHRVDRRALTVRLPVFPSRHHGVDPSIVTAVGRVAAAPLRTGFLRVQRRFVRRRVRAGSA